MACYRAILRWAEGARGIPFHIKRDHLLALSPALAESNVAIHDAETLHNVTRWIFKEQQTAKDAQAREAVAAALMAVRLLNTEYGPRIVEMQEKRMANSDRKGINFRVGEVVENIKEGYHGIVLGWDRVCKKPAMVKYKNIRFDQPFYSILPDQHDSVRAWGMPRVYAYVAQEHVQRMLKPKQIASGNMSNYFEAYCASEGRYIPKYYLRFEYPDDYEVQDAVPCDGGAMTPEQDKKTKSKRRKQAGESVTTRRTARRARKTSEVPEEDCGECALEDVPSPSDGDGSDLGTHQGKSEGREGAV